MPPPGRCCLCGSTQFPVFAPFTSQFFTFSGVDWIIFEVIAVAIILTATVIVKKIIVGIITNKNFMVFSLLISFRR